jgi:hypothetical protein
MKKLSCCTKLFMFFGYNYLVNNNTKEIHNLKNLHHNCHTDLIAKHNRFYATKKNVDKLLSHYDGCRWCMKDESKD